MQKIKLAIADDHALFRKGLVSILSNVEEIEFLHESENGAELIEKIKTDEPDVVLLDLEMPVMDGIEATRQIRRDFPEVKVMIISMHGEDEMMLKLVEEGVNGYLLKNADPEEVIRAIKNVAGNKIHFNHQVTQTMQRRLMEIKNHKPDNSLLVGLSERETEVLQLVAQGHTNPQIADLLCISLKTVESRKNMLMRKTGVKNNAGLVLFAVKSGLVTG